MIVATNAETPLPMRERIIHAVADLFYRHGTYRLGVDDIVRELKITRATLYRHFEGKEALVVAYLEHRNTMVQQDLSLLTSGKTPRDAVSAIFSSLVTKTGSNVFRGCSFLVAVAENPGSDPIRATGRAHKLFLEKLFREILDGVHERDQLAEQLLLLYEGALAASVLRPDARPAETARQVADMLVGHAVQALPADGDAR